MAHSFWLSSHAKCPESYTKKLTLSLSIPLEPKWVSDSMPSMCIVNKTGEIGLIIHTTYDLQSNTIYLGEQWGHLRNSLFCWVAVLRLGKKHVRECLCVCVCRWLRQCFSAAVLTDHIVLHRVELNLCFQ